MNLKDAFKSKSKEVEIAGVKLNIRGLTLAERDTIRALSLKHKDDQLRVTAEVVVMGCDEFKEGDQDYLLNEADGGIVERLSQKILDLSYLTDSTQKEAEKN